MVLFVENIVLSQGEVVTAQADDGAGGNYPVTVEAVVAVPWEPSLRQVVIRFPDQWNTAGDYWVSVTAPNGQSNKVFVTIKP